MMPGSSRLQVAHDGRCSSRSSSLSTSSSSSSSPLSSLLSKSLPSPASCLSSNPWERIEEPTKQRYTGNDADLAKEMNALSVEEREKVFEDIHGVAKVVEETPELVKKCIRDMDEFRIASRHKMTNRAFFLRPSLEKDTKFKLMFLRAEHFDPRKANERMGQYFDNKVDLFGDEMLVKDITVDDFNEDDLNVLRSGCGVLLSWRDRVGRPILFFDFNKIDFDRMSSKSLIRFGFFLATDASKDDEIAQQKGCCLVCYYGSSSKPDFDSRLLDQSLKTYNQMHQMARHLTQCGKVSNSLPIRFACIHLCYDDPQMDLIVQGIRIGINKATRFRFRAHLGSEIENEYKLQSFGIQTKSILENAKKGDTSLCHEYIQRKHVEQKKQQPCSYTAQSSSLSLSSEGNDDGRTTSTSNPLIPFPGPNDVLIGRGVPCSSYVGNQLWNQLIESNLEKYFQVDDRFEKTCITMNIVKTIQDETGGRFLQRTKDGWLILDTKTAREKAVVAFRSKRLSTNSTNKNKT